MRKMVIEKLTREAMEKWAKIKKIEERKREERKTVMIVEMESKKKKTTRKGMEEWKK